MAQNSEIYWIRVKQGKIEIYRRRPACVYVSGYRPPRKYELTDDRKQRIVDAVQALGIR